MNYRESERKRIQSIRDEMFRDAGGGIFNKIAYPFVLEKPEKNLWHKIRRDALKYFDQNKIVWWPGARQPAGHLLSSQVSCVNHLFYLRNDPVAILKLLKNIDANFIKAIPAFENGYIGFEVVSSGSYLAETPKNSLQTRGANCTSVDAMMLGEMNDGRRILLLIEWKYTEFYSNVELGTGSSGITRHGRYDQLVEDVESPFKRTVPIENFYYEPLYQLMRQTLLAWQMVENKDTESIKADDWIHLDVIPENNLHLRYNLSAPDLAHLDLESAWRSQLKNPDRYQIISPQKLLKPIIFDPDYRGLMQYLFKRYW